jgi:hypothetical protein
MVRTGGLQQKPSKGTFLAVDSPTPADDCGPNQYLNYNFMSDPRPEPLEISRDDKCLLF